MNFTTIQWTVYLILDFTTIIPKKVDSHSVYPTTTQEFKTVNNKKHFSSSQTEQNKAKQREKNWLKLKNIAHSSSSQRMQELNVKSNSHRYTIYSTV